MLLRGETFHTLLSIGFALLLTTHGFLVTSRKPLIRNVNVNIKDLPQEFEGFSIALLTDIHIGPSVGRARMIDTVQVVNQIHPDLVVISGDLVDGYVSYLKSRAAPLADMNSVYGTYFVTGNHEYMHEDVDHWLKYFKDDLNITTLKNQGVLLTKNDKKICLSGVDDVYTEHIHLPGHMMDINRALDDCPDKVPTIMLVHQPNGASRVLKLITESKKRVDLILSGHTHAGQMLVVWPLSFFSNRFFFGHYYYPDTDTQIYVSSGVNYWGPPIKMPNLCEVANVRLHRTVSDVVVNQADSVAEPIQ